MFHTLFKSQQITVAQESIQVLEVDKETHRNQTQSLEWNQMGK